MDPIVAQSALKHGLGEEEILHAYRNPIRVWDLGDGFTMIVGAGPAAAVIEVGVVQDRAPELGHCVRVELVGRARLIVLETCSQLIGVLEDLVDRPWHGHHLRNFSRARMAWTMTTPASPWAAIGGLVGTSGEAARQRYANRVA